MKAHLRYFWDTLRNSYWFVPALMAITAAALAVGMIALDEAIGYDMIETARWIYTGGPEGARAVLSTVAGSMITVAGVAFSITIVALALASAQFGPRLLSNFMRDKGNQVVLGTFVSTFLYSLLVLRTIRTEEDGGAYVPYIAVTVSIVLAIASLGVLIYFIHHASISIQAPHLIATVADELHDGINELFPEEVGHGPWPGQPSHASGLPDDFDAGARSVGAAASGYIDAVALDTLMEIATAHELLIRMEHRPGSYVVRGTPLALVWPPDSLDDAIESSIRGAFVTDYRRTPLQDVEFSINQLVEVALRALSPALNDPFTAIACIDHLASALCRLAERRIPSPYRFDDNQRLRLVAKHPLTFAGVVGSAFNQIRQNASYHVSVLMRMMEAIEIVIECVPIEDLLTPLIEQAELIRRAAADKVPDEHDRSDVDGRYDRLIRSAKARRRALASPRAGQPM
ncbi:MAG TPA: DUF2254 domain-containing protein [Longimicrobiaceae bacterium]|nr:DUF2254 domain-containing protein [Longimicrobiaceae bacterium]